MGQLYAQWEHRSQRGFVRVGPNLIDYVICHELAHAFYGNHSEEWRNLLSSVLPDWEQRKSQLETMLR